MSIVKSPKPLSEEGVTWHEYLNHYEGECSEMEPKINDACSTIGSNNSSILKAEVLTIKGLVSGLNIGSYWQDVIGESYQSVITSCTDSLGEVVNSISETFKSSEDVYRKLQAWLRALSANNENYSAYNAKKPNKEKACYYDIVTKTDPITNATSTEKVFNETVYKSDLQKWASNMERYYDQVIKLEGDIEDFLSQLDSYNGASVATTTINGLPSIKVAEMFKVSDLDYGPNAKTIEVPSGLGKYYTYMAWQMDTANNSSQLALRIASGQNFDERGFAKIGDRYVLAMTSTFGQIGDYVDIYFGNGKVLKGVLGDEKSQTIEAWDQDPANKWGHDNGNRMVEFIVDWNVWYGKHNGTGNNLPNPGTGIYKEEFGNNGGVVKVVNLGRNYFDENNIDRDGYTKKNLTAAMKA